MAYLPDIQTTAGRYIEAWNTADADQRWSLVHAAFAPDGVYLDPNTDPVVGQPALAAYIGMFRTEDAPLLEAAGPIDAHHDVFRMPWRLVGEGTVLATGLLVGTLDRERRIVRALHFIDA